MNALNVDNAKRLGLEKKPAKSQMKAWVKL